MLLTHCFFLQMTDFLVANRHRDQTILKSKKSLKRSLAPTLCPFSGLHSSYSDRRGGGVTMPLRLHSQEGLIEGL